MRSHKLFIALVLVFAVLLTALNIVVLGRDAYVNRVLFVQAQTCLSMNHLVFQDNPFKPERFAFEHDTHVGWFGYVDSVVMSCVRESDHRLAWLSSL